MLKRTLAILLPLLLTLSLFVPTAAATAPTPIDLLVISDSTGRGHVSGAVSGYSPLGGWRGNLLRQLWSTHDVHPVGRTVQPESAAYGGFEALGPATSVATAALDDVFAHLNGNPPEIVIIGMGINQGLTDAWAVPNPPTSIASTITPLIVGVAHRAPAAEIYVCTIPILNYGDASTQWSGLYNLYLPLGVQQARQAGARVMLIDCTAGLFDSSLPLELPPNAPPGAKTRFWYLSDTVHPSEAGYAAMADNIYRALRKHSPLLREAEN